MNLPRCRLLILFHTVLACALLVFDQAASAAVWKWGCIGAMGDGQVVFNRTKLVLISGKAPVGKLDEIIDRDDFVTADLTPRVVATYQPNDINGGFEKSMRFSTGTADGKLTLIQLSSKKTGRKSGLVAGCRDESTDRFQKSYRIERDGMAPQTINLTCIEYQLSTRGGRTCR